jgi:autotransporter-associated beta strand protein
VTSIATNTNPNIPLLTFNTPAGDVADFSGSVLDGANLNSTLGITTTSPVVVSLSKSGLGTQILSGSNNHTGTITNTAGELRFSRRVSLYAGNTNLWSNLAVNSGATLGLSLGGTEGFTSADLNTLVGNTGIIKAGAKIGLDVAASNSPATLATVFSNSANPNGVAFSKTGAGQLTLSGYSGNLTNSMTVNGGTLRFTNLSTYSGTPSLSGGAVLDLGGATFPIPNTVAITDGSMVNFTPGVADPFAPTANVTYTGFSFAVNRLNDGTNGTRTFTLTNSVLTVGGEVATNGFTISGASNGIMRFTGATTGQGDTNSTKGQITLNGSAILEFASNAVFDSYRALSISSASNPTVLVSGGNISNLSYVIFGAASTTTGTLRVTSGSLSVANPNPSGNGLFFGQNFGVGTLLLEGGSVSTPVIKVQSGRANINVSGGSLNIVTTNAPGAPANTWALSLNGAVNFTMTGGSIVATNSKFNLSTVNSTNFLTNVVYQHNGGVIRSIEMSAGAGSFLMSAGTNVASAGMFVGDNSNGVATFTQTGGLMQILGEAGSTAANDLVIGSANGNGIYQLNGGVLEVFGKIRKNSGTSSLVLNGGVLRSTNGTNQGAFISSPVETKVGSNGAIFEITDAGVTNTVQATLSDVSGQSGKLIKRGAGALALARSNLSYSGSTRVENGLLVVTDTAINAGFTAQISSNAISMTFSNPPASNLSSTNTYPILPANLEGGTASIVATQLAGNQPITFDPATGTAQVITTALGSSTISVTGSANFTYNGTPQGPDTCDTTGSTGVVTYEYAGTGGTSYGPSATKPTGAGSYTVTASLAGDSNHYAATSSAYAFTIIKATPSISQVPTASGITSGQALSASLLSGGTGSVGGGFAWTDSTVIPIGTGSFSVTFTPTDTANYNTTTTNVNVIVSPAGPTFANAYSNLPTDVAPNGLTYLVNYAFGGTSTNDPKLPQLDTTDPTRLALVAYVRTNDTGGALLQVKGQKGASLSSWDPNLIDGVPTGDNYGAPAGTQKQIFSVTNGGERLFLRLKVTQ